MKCNKSFYVILLLIIIWTGILPGTATAQSPQAQKTTAQLQISSSPADAWIFINGHSRGKTGEQIIKLPAGTYEVVILKPEYIIQYQKVALKAAEIRKLHFKLPKDIPVPYHLSIKNAPKFLESSQQGVAILQRVYWYLLKLHVNAPAKADLIRGSIETILQTVANIRKRWIRLRHSLAPEPLKRYYGEEVDLAVYPQLEFRQQASKDHRITYEVTIGPLREKFDLLTDQPSKMLRTLIKVMNMVISYDQKRLISYDALFMMAIQGMIGMVHDPFTYFLSPQEMKEVQIEQKQRLGGLGMVVSHDPKEGVVVIAPIDGTPAARAGICEGDHIIKVGDRLTRQMSLNEAVSLMRGEPGTKVTITVRSKSNGHGFTTKTLTLTREIIKIKFIRSMMYPHHIGYIKISSFMGEKVPQDFAQALTELEKQGLQGLVIDLRNNPGGLMNVALSIADLFVAKGLIFSIKGRWKQVAESYQAHAAGTHTDYPIVVLVNEGSASASEIVAGILKHTKRATVVGTKTFGKGSVQHVYPLLGPQGPSLALTVAYYYILGKYKIHKKGILPDVEVKIPRKIAYQIARRSIFQKAKPADWKDPQLDKALQILQKAIKSKSRPQAPLGPQTPVVKKPLKSKAQPSEVASPLHAPQDQK